MKILVYLLIIAGLLSCNSNEEEKQIQAPVVFSYRGSGRGSGVTSKYKIDSLTIDKIHRHDPKDSLIASKEFMIGKNYHIIRMYTSDFYANTDGGDLSYELDSLGIFYRRSTTWPSYKRLSSTNDSINEVIDVALETILLYPKLSCYHCEVDNIQLEHIKFIPPEVE